MAFEKAHQMWHISGRQARVVGDPDGAVLQRMHGILIGHRGGVDGAIEARLVVWAADRRVLWISYLASDVVVREVGISHHAGDGANRCAPARREGMHEEEDDQYSASDPRAPSATPLDPVDLRLASDLALALEAAGLELLAPPCALRLAGWGRLFRLRPTLCHLRRGATLAAHNMFTLSCILGARIHAGPGRAGATSLARPRCPYRTSSRSLALRVSSSPSSARLRASSFPSWACSSAICASRPESLRYVPAAGGARASLSE